MCTLWVKNRFPVSPEISQDFLDLYHHEKLMFNQHMTLKRQGLVDLKQWEECRASAQLPSCSHVFFPTPKAVKSQPGVETQHSQNSQQVSPAFWLDCILQTASPVALLRSPSAGLWREAQLAWGTGAHRGSVLPVSLEVLSWRCWGSQVPAPTRVMRQARGAISGWLLTASTGYMWFPLLSTARHPWGLGLQAPFLPV